MNDWTRAGWGLLALFLVSGCVSVTFTPERTVFEASAADITISMAYLSYEELINLYGDNTYGAKNPFIDYPGLLSPMQIFVFDTRIETVESAIKVSLEDIRMEMNGKSASAASIPRLSRLWSVYSDTDEFKIEQITSETMLPEELTVEPGESVQGYLVFLGNYPKKGGEARAVFNLSTPDGERGPLEILMNFGSEEKPLLGKQKPQG